MGDSFVDNLIKEQDKRKETDIIICDIETGASNDRDVLEMRSKKIVEKIMNEEYTAPSNYKPETAMRKKIEFEKSKPERAQFALRSLTEKDAVSPYFNKIHIIGTLEGDKVVQIDSTMATEKEMIQDFADRSNNKKVVSYGSLDPNTLLIKAAKYEVALNCSFIDLMRLLSFYNIFGKKEVLKLDLICLCLGIKPNKYNLDPALIGEIYESMEWEINSKKIEKILAYNREDLRMTNELFWKTYSTGLVIL